jgi:hypothetical protein
MMRDGTTSWQRVKAARLGLERETKPRRRWRWPWVRRTAVDALTAKAAELEQRVQRAEAEAREARAILAGLSRTYFTPASRWPGS